MAKTKSRKPKKKKSHCMHMHHTHCVYMTTLEALSLISAATHAVRSGYDDGDDSYLESAVNGLLDQCNIDCEFDGRSMTLTVNPVEDA